MPGPHVVIVGAGASGTLVALHLLRNTGASFRISLIERAPSQLARGVAYRSDADRLPLNVPASGMSLYDAEPDDFVRFIEARREVYASRLPGFTPLDFVPRSIFGDYLSAELEAARRRTRSALEVITDEVIELTRAPGGLRVQLEGRGALDADSVVLAFGNAPCASSLADAREGGWSRGWMGALEGHESLLFLGAGLTTIDNLLALEARGHEGSIVVVSRHGRWPRTHTRAEPIAVDASALRASMGTPLALVRYVRALVRAHPRASAESVVEGLRPHVVSAWQSWDGPGRRAFVTHLRPLWDVHRHRIPVESAALVSRLVALGRLELVAGHVRPLGRTEDGMTRAQILPRGDAPARLVQVHHFVRCTGPLADYARIDAPLVRSMRASGLLVPDPLGLGIETDAEGRLRSAEGLYAEDLLTLGPTRRGALWESTALGEIRSQAEALAQRLVARSAS